MKYWLSCESFDGMFSSEVGISVTTADEQKATFYVDKELYREGNGRKQPSVLVWVTQEPSEGEESICVLLPTQPFETGRYVMVHRSQVEPGVAA